MAKKFVLSRRTVLRGMGTALALPFLDAMGSSVHAAETSPSRLVSIYFSPYGPCNESWYPKTFGKDYEFSPSLKPLAPFRSELSILTGLNYINGGVVGHQGQYCFLTGVMITHKPPYVRPESMDMLAARKISMQTRYPYLNMSPVGSVGNGGEWAISVNRHGVPITPESNPQAIFNKLFVEDRNIEGRNATLKRIHERRSLLDELLEQLRKLKERVGRADKEKLDEYLSSVRETELQLELDRKWLDHPKPEVSDTEFNRFHFSKKSEHLRLFLNLMHLAIQTDSTRVLTLSMGNNIATGDSSWLADVGVRDWHQELQHHGNRPDKLELLKKLDLLQIGLLAEFLERLHKTREGENTLLERTVTFYGSSMNNGRELLNGSGAHGSRNIAMLLAGGSKLGLKHGQHLDLRPQKDRPHPPICNLFLTILQSLGVETPTFHNGTARIDELS